MRGPAAAEERARTLGRRLTTWREEGLLSADAERQLDARLATRWRSYGIFVALILFFFTALGVAATAYLTDEALAGVGAIAIAEVLIARRWFGTGVESALWIGGLFALIAALPSEGKPEAALLFAAASALAGWRVRNPFLGALAAIFAVGYLAWKDWHLAALIAGLAIAAIACVALVREWRRPSTEWLWIATLVAMIPTAYFAGDPQRFHVLTFLVAGAVLLVAGIRMRHHAPLVASAIAFVIAGGEWFENSDAPLELLLAASGVLLIAIAFALSRALRERTSGFVATPIQLTGADDALQHVSVIAAAPHHPVAGTPGRPQGEGGFGGAGASGGWD